jgi:membrane-associated protein
VALVTDVLEWLQALPQPALVGATGALVFAECTIGLGFIAPGEGGLLVAATTVDSVSRFLILWAVVTVAAGIGDSIGYAIGRRFGPALRETKVIQKYGAEGWDKATDILRRRGAWAVFFARFLPVVRTLTPAAAGTSGLAYRKFLPAVVAGAACWSAMHIAIGAALGEAAKKIEGIISTGGLIVVGGAIVAVLITMTIRKRRKKARLATDVPVTPDDAELADVAVSPATATVLVPVVPEVIADARLPREKSAARVPMQRLAEAETALRDLMSQLSDTHGGPSVPQHIVDDARRTATETAERLRTIAAKVEAVEAATTHTNADQRVALEDGTQDLLIHLERGLDGYRGLIAAAGQLVLAGSPNPLPDELVEATDNLAGLAAALQELSA